MNQLSARDVALDPEWLPHTYDADGANLTFVCVPRSARQELIFLSDRHFGGNFRKAEFPEIAVAAEAASADQAPIYFIFHSSHCCSTRQMSMRTRGTLFDNIWRLTSQSGCG